MSYFGPLDKDGTDGGLASGVTLDKPNQNITSDYRGDATGATGDHSNVKTGRPDGTKTSLDQTAEGPLPNQYVTMGYGDDPQYNTDAQRNHKSSGGTELQGMDLRGYVLNEPTPGVATVDSTDGRIFSVSNPNSKKV